MKSKLKFSLITVIMLVLLGFSFQDQARGQIGLDGLFCPDVPHTTGLLETIIVGPGLVIPDFTAALIGTMEVGPNGIDVVGGLDWQHVNHQSLNTSNNPTNETGSQLVSWWTQKDSRNTYLTVSNLGGPTELHVVIFNEDCVEIRDFCDFYTPIDTHEYDFGNLVTNSGQSVTIPSGNEGFVVVTPVENCDTSEEVALDHELLAGQTVIVDQAGDYSYGINTYARQSVCYDTTETVNVNKVPDGRFFSGIPPWSQRQQTVAITEGAAFQPPADIPGIILDPPAAFVLAQPSNPNVDYNGGSYSTINGVTPPANLTGVVGNDTNVAVLESAPFNLENGLDSNTLTYDLQAYLNASDSCANWVGVLLIRTDPTDSTNGIVVTNGTNSNCYGNDGVSLGNLYGGACRNLLDGPDANVIWNASNLFEARTGFLIGESLTWSIDGEYRVQVIAAMKDSGTCDTAEDENIGALVSRFVLDGKEEIDFICDRELTGDFNARLDYIEPETLYAQFNVLPGNVTAGSDVVHINFADSYDPYRPTAAFSRVDISIFDEDEFPLSCGLAEVCFVRLGIDDSVENSDTFTPPTIPPPTTAPPTTAPPTTAPPTPTPTNNGGGSSSCAIAGSPVQLGTALANVLIPLVPVAFAFGVRAVRRRKK